MKRFATALYAGFALACSCAVFACTADVTDGCVAGPCSDDASIGPVTTGSGGNPCFAAWEPVDQCDVSKFPATGDIPCDVWAVMHKDPIDSGGCHTCHQNPPLNGAPFPELTWEDLQFEPNTFTTAANPHPRVFQLMARAIQPTPPDSLTPMPLAGHPALSCDDAKTLSTWLKDCATPVAVGMGSGNCCAAQKDPTDPDAGCPGAATP